METIQDLAYSYVFPFSLENLDKTLFILASDEPLEFLDMNLDKSLIKSVKKMNNMRIKQQFCLQLLCCCSHYRLHCHSSKPCLYYKAKFYNQDVIAWLVADQDAVGVGFGLFSITFVVFSFEFLARPCKIVRILGALGKNLAKILAKGFTKMQDPYQEFQEFSHWLPPHLHN